MMRISILIPTYNYAHYINYAIDSVLAQADPNYQIIIIDDGSTDNTAAIAESYVQKFPNIITYIYQQNCGAAAARNRGVQVVDGDYLLFLDADDRLLPGALQQFRQFQRQHPTADVICAGHVSVTPDGKREMQPFAKPLTTNPLQNFMGYLRKQFSLLGGGMLLRRYLFARLRYPEEFRNAEDMVLFAHALASFHCVSFAEPVVEIYKHSDSLRHHLAYNREVGLQIVDRIFDPAILPPEFLKYRNEYYARRCLSLFRTFYLAGEYQEAKQFYKKAIKAHLPALFELGYLQKYLRIWFK
jgi:glycosyltransferase involved in cell wall biosynthesis